MTLGFAIVEAGDDPGKSGAKDGVVSPRSPAPHCARVWIENLGK